MAGRQIDRQTKTARQIDRQTDCQTDRRTGKSCQTDRQTDRQRLPDRRRSDGCFLTVLVVFPDHVAEFFIRWVETKPSHHGSQFLFADGVISILIKEIERRSKLYQQTTTTATPCRGFMGSKFQTP